MYSHLFYKYVLVCLLLIWNSVSQAQDTTLVVKNQHSFSQIDAAIVNAAKKGKKEIRVEICKGKYTFSDDEIQLKGIPQDVSVFLAAHGAKIYAESNKVDRKTMTTPNHIYYANSYKNVIDFWSEVRQCNQLIEVVDSVKNVCRLKLKDVHAQVKVGDFIQISQWYLTHRYEVKDSREGYVYFVADNLKRCENGKSWNVNYDYVYGKEMPRYRIWKRVNNRNKLIEGKASRFINMQKIKMKSFRVEGLEFCGNASQSQSALIQLMNVTAEDIILKDCIFRSCHTQCLILGNTANVNISDCAFYNNRTTAIYSGGGCKNVHITHCFFENNSTGWNNTFCINIKGKDFLVAHNKFKDFAYGAIAIGEHGNDKKVKVSGIIEENEIYYTPRYYENYKLHTLMDSGAIYLWTQNDDVHICRNNIHDNIGMKDNRGIFCDDGASNFRITDNVILRVPNSYSIDSRKVKDFNPYGFKNNANNYIAYNIVDNGIRFMGYGSEERHCRKSKNYVLLPHGQKLNKEMKYEDLELNEKDEIVDNKWLKKILINNKPQR